MMYLTQIDYYVMLLGDIYIHTDTHTHNEWREGKLNKLKGVKSSKTLYVYRYQ